MCKLRIGGQLGTSRERCGARNGSGPHTESVRSRPVAAYCKGLGRDVRLVASTEVTNGSARREAECRLSSAAISRFGMWRRRATRAHRALELVGPRIDLPPVSVYPTRRMKARALRAILKQRGCVEVRQKGSHLRMECGNCRTTVPVHAGEDLRPGTLRQIVGDLELCLGKRWLDR